jgi:predicted ATPase
MELYVQAGNRRAALVQYESCRSILQAELGIGPEPETTALVERIRAGEIKELTPDPILLPQHNLLPEATSFVGREDEVSSLSEQLTLSDCRLLTLVGPGGIGKTRLALKVAEQKLGRFEDGVFFIALASLHTPDAVVSAIASAVRFRFYEVEQSFEDQFLHYLHNKELLLILDNFEHQMAQVSLVEMVLTTAPRIKFLVTSREALNLDWEWRYEVRGLDIPKTARALNQSSASRLFLERARRLQPQFSLADHADGILRICQLVNGMPLGIELAASWLKTLPCEAIADEIQNSIDFLATTLRNVPERHRSMRAVFDQSWRMLSDEERDVLARLAVFRGGFEREAAQQIAGANLIMLTGLVDKSLLQCDQRYSVHELLRQYVTEQMPSQAMYAAYSAYYMEFFIAREADIKGRRQWAAIDELTIEFENIRAAWRWYVEQQDISMINRALDSLFVFSMFRHFGTTEELLREVREREDLLRDVRDQLEPPEHEQIWGRIAARHEVLRLPNPEVRATIEHCLTIARQYEDRNEIAFCLMALGYDAMSDGDYDRTIHFFEESLAAYRELNDLFYVAQLMSNLGLICGLAGQYERAVELLEDSQNLQRKIGDEIGATVSLNKKRIVQHLMRTDYR